MIKILMADDHAIVREGMRQILADSPDIEIVAEASDGDEAYALVRNGGWNFLLLDISMPGKNILDIIKQAKQQFPQHPILIMSMYPEDQYAIRMLRAGVDGYLTKASAPEQLLTAIRKLANGEKYISLALAEQLINELSPNKQKEPHRTLSDREFQVFSGIVKGKALTEIANEMTLSVKTISTFRTRLLKKMQMTKNVELIHYATKHNLLL
ncbi:MAG: response regulator transcription factor [Methylococcaceae bacterium]